MEVTGKNQDECMVALHDCNEDVNRAINFLLEGTSDTVKTHLLVLSFISFYFRGSSDQHTHMWLFPNLLSQRQKHTVV